MRWKGLLKGSYLRKLVQHKSQTRALAGYFSDWHSEFVCTSNVRVHLRRKWQRAQRHVFRQLEQLIVTHQRKATDKRKKDAMVTCFTMIRLFRAWKLYFAAGRLTPLEEARGTLKANNFFYDITYLRGGAWFVSYERAGKASSKHYERSRTKSCCSHSLCPGDVSSKARISPV